MQKILILTKSSKNKNYCIAGINIESGDWMRLVSNDKLIDGAIPKEYAHFSPFNIVNVDVLEKKPQDHQVENCLINLNTPAEILKKNIPLNILLRVLKDYCQDYEYLFCNTKPYLTSRELHSLNYSLLITPVSDLIVYNNLYTKKKADFIHNEHKYTNISVTDPDTYNDSYLEYKKALIIMSLPLHTPTEERYYKFIAKIIPINE